MLIFKANAQSRSGTTGATSVQGQFYQSQGGTGLGGRLTGITNVPQRTTRGTAGTNYQRAGTRG